MSHEGAGEGAVVARLERHGLAPVHLGEIGMGGEERRDLLRVFLGFWRATSCARWSAFQRQRASGRRRITPVFEHGASTSTRSKSAPSSTFCTAVTLSSFIRARFSFRRARRFGLTSCATISPAAAQERGPPMRHAICTVLPPGAAQKSSTDNPSPGATGILPVERSSKSTAPAVAGSCTMKSPSAKPGWSATFSPRGSFSNEPLRASHVSAGVLCQRASFSAPSAP